MPAALAPSSAAGMAGLCTCRYTQGPQAHHAVRLTARKRLRGAQGRLRNDGASHELAFVQSHKFLHVHIRKPASQMHIAISSGTCRQHARAPRGARQSRTRRSSQLHAAQLRSRAPPPRPPPRAPQGWARLSEAVQYYISRQLRGSDKQASVSGSAQSKSPAAQIRFITTPLCGALAHQPQRAMRQGAQSPFHAFDL